MTRAGQPAIGSNNRTRVQAHRATVRGSPASQQLAMLLSLICAVPSILGGLPVIRKLGLLPGRPNAVGSYDELTRDSEEPEVHVRVAGRPTCAIDSAVLSRKHKLLG